MGVTGQLHRGLSYEEYCALPGVNTSLLKEIDKTTLLHAKAMLDGKRRRDSDALDFGHSFHDLVLRGKEDFVVHPATYASAPAKVRLTTDFESEWKPSTKVCREWKATQEADGFEVLTPDQYEELSKPKPWNWNANTCKSFAMRYAGKIIHSEGEATAIRSMAEAVRASPVLRPFLDGDTEIAVTGTRKGRPIKALIDLLPKQENAPVIDFKKCRSASPRAFVADAVKLGYHMQASFYLDALAQAGVKRDQFWFVAVEDTPPHAVSIIKFFDGPLTLLRVGRTHYRCAFDKLIAAETDNDWPGYAAVEAEDYAPGWMKEELERTA